MDNDILVKPQLRPCLVYATKSIQEPRKAFFHMWTSNPFESDLVVALVEYENGKCELVDSSTIRFLDSGALFYEQCWPDDEDIPLF